MDDSHKPRLGIAVAALLESYGQEVTQPRLMGYWLALRPLELQDVERAIAHALRSCSGNFPPPPAKIYELATGGSAGDQAILAWQDVLRAMPIGSYRSVDFSDKCINAAIRSMGGWPALLGRCSDAEGEKWCRLDFLKAYAVFAGRGGVGDAGAPLSGLAEVEVHQGKLSKPVPVCIDARPVAPGLTSNQQPRRIAAHETN